MNMAGALPIPSPVYGVRHKTAPGRGTVAATGAGGFSFKLLLVFFVLLYSNLPLIFPALESVRPAQVIGGLALMALLYERARARQNLAFAAPDGYLLMGFIVAAALSSAGAVWPSYAVDATLNLVKMGVVYLVIVNTVTSEKRLRTLLWVMVLCGLFPALGSLWYWQQGLRLEGRARWMGVFANPNEMACSLVILIPLAIALSRRLRSLSRLLVWVMIAAYITSIYLSYSRGGLIGLFVMFAYLGWRQKNSLARLGMIAVLLVGVLAVPLYWSRGEGFNDLQGDMNLQERLITYQVALAMYADSPLLGVGINCSAVAWPLYVPPGMSHHKWLVTHNTILQAMSETGTLGFVLLMSFYGTVFYRAWKAGRSKIPGQEGVAELAMALEVGFLGFVVCGLSGGYLMSWFPYLLAGLIGAAGTVAATSAQTVRNSNAARSWQGRIAKLAAHTTETTTQ
jgi:O-antigen ligase